MKKLSALFSITIVSFIILNCASTQQLTQLAWYEQSNWSVYYYFVPHKLKSSQEAMSTIQFLQSNLLQEGNEIIDLKINQYGLLTKSSETIETTRYKVDRVTTSGFANNSLSSYYSNTAYVGRNVTDEKTNLYTQSLVFKNIDFIELKNTTVNSDWDWRVAFCRQGKELYVLKIKDKETALDLINAVYTLSSKNGAVIKTNVLGILSSSITPEQAGTLGVIEQKGLVITLLFKDSPAENNGLKINDIITHIDGNIITTNEDYEKIISRKGKNKFKLILLRITDFNVRGNIYNYETLEKDVSLN